MPTSAIGRVRDLLSDLRALAPAGAAIGLHVRFATPTFMVVTYPPSWRQEYSRDGLLLRDPIVAWAFANRGTTAWADLAAQDPDGVLVRAAAHGLRQGLAVSVEDGGSLSVAGFARGDRPFAPAEAAEVEARLLELHRVSAPFCGSPEALRAEFDRLSGAITHP